ncbi:DUF2065 domain-containing protein [Aliiruegeria sabulilitoris]|uniref:DUF2065 domain-containing protein n=1 Tax=Aliiruegeria sabulilitoris TaxID=1510458 RepID=UPI00083572AE
MDTILLAIGLVFVLEGLVLALAPSRIDEILELIRQMPVETRRLVGLLAITTGGILLWLATWLARASRARLGMACTQLCLACGPSA